MSSFRVIPQPVLIFLALLAGIIFVYSVQFKSLTSPVGMLAGGLIAFGVYQVSFFRRTLLYLFRKTQTIQRKSLNRVTVCLVPVGCVILYLTHIISGRPFEMMWHDEFQFHLQSQLVARGRLWMPPHPLGAFFDTFYVLMQPVYAPQSFPGAAMMYVPTVWLNLPTWFMPLVVAAIGAALVWRLLSQLVGPSPALIGWAVLLSLPGYQRLSTMYLAQIPVMVLCLVAILASLRYQKTRGWGMAAVIGICMGWAAITRPLDAACWGIVLMGLLFPVVRTTRWRRLLPGAFAAVVAASPFLGLQMIFNQTVTGSVLQTPFDYYNRRDQPALAFGSDLKKMTQAPASDIPQKQMFYREFTLRWVKLQQNPSMTWWMHWKNRLNILQPTLGGSIWLIPLAVIGLLGVRSAKRFWITCILGLFVIGYSFYPIFLPHYMTFALPGWVLLFATIPEVVAKAFTSKKRDVVGCGIALIVIGTFVGASAEFIRRESPDYVLELLRNMQAKLAQVRPPAIVLFTPPPGGQALHLELVYNDDVAWPDDSPVIRAHDRGPDNRILYEYYAHQQTDRWVWRFNRQTGELVKLGKVRELASSASLP